AWGDRPESLAGLDAYLKTGVRPRRVLAINEPNLKDQAFISPQTTAQLYERVKTIADRYGVPVCGPQMSLGSPTEGSITAYDPLEKKTTTYTFMVPFLKAVLAYTGDTPVPETAFHAYGDIHELRWALDTMHREFGRPVWVTEFNHVPDPKAALTYLMQSVDLMERTPYVSGYAWFKERTNDAKWPIALLGEKPGTLTPLGEAYVAMPVHEANLYYRVPGRLQAERYVAMEGLEITPTGDTDGLADMTTTADGATLDVNVQVDRGGRFTLDLRTSGAAGTIEVSTGDRRLGDIPTPRGAWSVARVPVTLPAGPQRLRLRFAQKGQTINWIGFVKG
ncbi:carbohydrate-binding protein, partial [bacterium]